MVDRTKNRSDYYQSALLECPCAPDMLTEMADSKSIASQLNPYKYNDEYYDLKDRLRKAMWRLIDTQLTKRQRQVIHLYKDGYTQTEIAKKLNINQSSITKSLNGNCDYRNGRKIYGGARKRLQKLASKDEEIQTILKRIAEIQEDEW